MYRTLVAVAVLAGSVQAGAKIDEGIAAGERFAPVFVRMTEQVFKQGGDYETFCRANHARKRTGLRREVMTALKRNADASWEAIEPAIKRLTDDGAVRRVARYWVVNGFACEATGDACRVLAEDPHVGFVYLQRLPIPQQDVTHPALPQAVLDRYRKVYDGVLAEWTNDDEQAVTADGFDVPWNVKRLKADRAWIDEVATGRGVVVAMCDSGLMVTTSLTRALWRNPDEPFNGKDDDANGYADDLFGWDFARDSWYCLGDGPVVTHGSMCGGIVAGRPANTRRLITGVAPRARLMILRGAGYLKAYEYALANGADILSMSYMWPGRPLGPYRGVYRLAHEHLAAAGIVAVGGAGNFAGTGPRSQPVGKQIALPKDIPCVIAVAGIRKDGSKAPASSEGPCYWTGVAFYDDYPKDAPLAKPDVTGCFGGYPVWGRPNAAPVKRGQWTLVSDEGAQIGLVTGPQGNSFAGPHAAGVAALMLSVNFELPAWRVKALMEATCTDIGDKGRDYTFGAGLLNALDAVRAAKKAGRDP